MKIIDEDFALSTLNRNQIIGNKIEKINKIA